MDDPVEIRREEFAALWKVFLSWRVAVLEWGLSPKQVFEELQPREQLELCQFLNDERYRVIERLLINPDPEVRQGFTETYREFIELLHTVPPDADWWQEELRPWLETFLSYAVATVPRTTAETNCFSFRMRGWNP